MSSEVIDSDAREQALDPARSFIIQAPAGSGKTELLIQRYLTLLSMVDAPEEIIAITFTRKAAAEMQSRILNALDNAAGGASAETAHGRKTLVLAAAALKRDTEKEWDLLQNPARMRIQTIDSLCAMMTRQMPILSQLGAQPEILEDPQPLYEQAAIDTLALIDSGTVHAEPVQVLLRHLDNDHVRVRRLLISMLGRRDQWLPHVSGIHQREHLEAALHDLVQEKLDHLVQLLPEDLHPEMAELTGYAAANLQESDPGHSLTACAGLETLPGTGGHDLARWQAIMDLLLTSTNGWRKQLNVKNGFPPAGNKKDPGAENREHMKKRLQEVIRRLQEEPALHNHLVDIRMLPAVTYTDNDWEVVRAVCEVLRLAAAQLQVIFAGTGQMDFNGVAQAAIAALGTDDETTDLARQLDYRMQHILVDEFQDISVSQYKLLQRLTAQWSRDDNRSLFLVGDPQQSIYRFREAEVGWFVETFERGSLGHVELSPLRLQVNFRSNAGVVDWVNACFSRVFPAESDANNGAVAYSESVAHHAGSTDQPVSLDHQYGNDADSEADAVINRIREIRSRDDNAQVTILVRSRAHLARIVPKLKQQGIAFSAVDIDPLSHQPVIQDLLMITRACLHPADRIAWLAVLRAPWCGLELEDMLALFNDREKTVFESLQQQDIGLQQNPATAKRLQDVYEVFRQAYANRHRKTLRQTIESVWCQLGGPATLASTADLADVNAFLDLLGELEEGGILEDLDALTDAVARLFANPSSATGNTVQIMTIHKAKGLEFDHVIVPGLGRRPPRQDTRLLAWWIRPRDDGGEDLLLAPIKEAGVSESVTYKYLARVDRDRQQYEDARLLYVAITRAIHTAHLFAHVRMKEEKDGTLTCAPEAGSLLEHLWPVVGVSFENNLPADMGEEEGAGVPVSPELRRLHENWQRPEPAAAVVRGNELTRKPLREGDEFVEYEWAGATIRHIGTVVHAFIEQVARNGPEQWDDAAIRSRQALIRHALIQAGVEADELDRATSQVSQALLNMHTDPVARWILDPAYTTAGNEYRVSGVIDGQLVNAIIDRTFIDKDGTRWIIDYKTSRHEGPDIEAFLRQEEERYRPQLEMYARLMQAIDDIPTRQGLYYPLLKQWLEITG